MVAASIEDKRNERAEPSWMRDAVWLAWSDVRRTPFSYVAALFWPLLVGPLAASLLNGVFVVEGLGAQGERMEALSNGALLDFWFLAVTPAFTINLLFNPDYGSRFTTDSMSRRMAFLRGMPVPVPAIVAGRMLMMLTTLLVSAPPFFTVVYLFARGSEEVPAGAGFLWFALIWIGYALVVGGYYMYIWLGISGKTDRAITLLTVLTYVIVAVSVNLLSDVGLVEGTTLLAREYGVLAGVVALVAGGAAFVLWGRVSVQRLERREIFA